MAVCLALQLPDSPHASSLSKRVQIAQCAVAEAATWLRPAQVIIPFPAAGPSTKALEKTASRLKGIQLMPCRTVAEVNVGHICEAPVQVLIAVCLQRQSVVLSALPACRLSTLRWEAI